MNCQLCLSVFIYIVKHFPFQKWPQGKYLQSMRSRNCNYTQHTRRIYWVKKRGVHYTSIHRTSYKTFSKRAWWLPVVLRFFCISNCNNSLSLKNIIPSNIHMCLVYTNIQISLSEISSHIIYTISYFVS